MQFLNPIWLWGLTGILIPIGIHLLSRKQGRTIKIGSIRHLEDTDTKKFKSLRLNEIVLLAVRCFLITILVFLLSGLDFEGMKKKGLRWLIIENGLDREPEFSSVIDSLRQKKFQIKLLTAGFPDIKDSMTNEFPLNYWNLIEDLEREPLDEVVVLSYSYAVGFRGLRKALPDNVQWISGTPDPVEFPLQAVRMANDSVLVRMGKSSGAETAFTSKYVAVNKSQPYFKSAFLDSIPIETIDTLSIKVLSDPEFQYDKKMVMAALTALKEISPYVFDFDTLRIDEAAAKRKNDWVIWLSAKPIPSFNCNTLSFQNTNREKGGNLIQPKNIQQSNPAWIFTKRLNEEVALQNNLTVQLALLLFPKERQETRTHAFDKRGLPEQIMWDKKNSTSSGLKATAEMISTKKLIVILFLLILMLERFLVFKRNQ